MVFEWLAEFLLAPLGEHYLAGSGCPFPETLSNQMPLRIQPRQEAGRVAT